LHPSVHMLLKTTLSALGLTLLGVSALGCAVRGRAAVSTDAYVVAEPQVVYGGEVVVAEPAPQVVVFTEPPPLVVVEQDVYVVENSSYAIYFIDGFYWHVGSGGGWYRASRWDDPWARVELNFVPTRIVHRDHHSYVHFHASASTHVYRQPRTRGGSDRALRAEQRSERRDARPGAKPAAPKRDVRGRIENAARPDADHRRTVPSVKDRERSRAEPRTEMERKPVERARPRPEADRDRPKPDVQRAPPRVDPDQARPEDDGKKTRKKVEEKRKKKKPLRKPLQNPTR